MRGKGLEILSAMEYNKSAAERIYTNFVISPRANITADTAADAAAANGADAPSAASMRIADIKK